MSRLSALYDQRALLSVFPVIYVYLYSISNNSWYPVMALVNLPSVICVYYFQGSLHSLDGSCSLPHMSRLNITGAGSSFTSDISIKADMDAVDGTVGSDALAGIFNFDMSLLSPSNDFMKLQSTPGGIMPSQALLSGNSPVSPGLRHDHSPCSSGLRSTA